ncbi:MAG: DUF4430 domain-containing protein, partial [Patescibacteria group bacterium]
MRRELDRTNQSMRTKYLVLITVSSLILFGVVFYTIQSSMNAKLLKTTEWPAPYATTTAETREVKPTEIGVVVSIEGTRYDASIPADATVLEAMRTLADSGAITFSGREYPSLGFFVESLNGKYGGDGFYWILYVNGKTSETGASQTSLKAGDAVEWRYESR